MFTRFKRVIRDITRGNGKDIQLVLLGEKTELDKRMIDELGDPLIHLVRNAADHGIESGEDRLAAGKPAQGTVFFLVSVAQALTGLALCRGRRWMYRPLPLALFASGCQPEQHTSLVFIATACYTHFLKNHLKDKK